MTNSVHDSNQELMGQGIGNLLAGFLGGFTGSGATACAVANIQAGGTKPYLRDGHSLFFY